MDLTKLLMASGVQTFMKVVTAIALAILFDFALPAVSDNQVVGKWSCVSVSNETGATVAWTLNVKEDADTLSAFVIMAETGDEIPVLEPTVQGNTFSCKIKLNRQETVELTSTIGGKQLTGTFKGKDSGTGTLKCLRAE